MSASRSQATVGFRPKADVAGDNERCARSGGEKMMGYWTGHRLRGPQGGQAQGPTGAQRLPFASEWVDWNVAVPSSRSVTAIRQSGVVVVR